MDGKESTASFEERILSKQGDGPVFLECRQGRREGRRVGRQVLLTHRIIIAQLVVVELLKRRGACGHTPDPQFARRHPPSSTSRGQPCRHLLPSSGDALARTNGGLTAFTLCPSFRQIPV